MRPGDEHAFRADDPVAQYWLHNCVGFHVRGPRGGRGVVDAIRVDVGGEPVLAIRRPVLGTMLVPAARVESVDPWDETIVLRAVVREPRPRRSERTDAAGRAVASAGHAAAIAAAAVTRKFLAAVARLLLAVAALLRTHAPVARRHAAGAASTLGAMGAAYATEARRAYREQRAAVNAWREERRREAWADDSAITRAGADEAGAREEERVSR
jgi:hypothetical protein